ncbi:unnamed protein product [Tenebrio molitor]|nr:unnamed protein product [Tenebrio molitor]
MSYEKAQKRLQQLWQDTLSGENDNISLFGESSDEYVPSSNDEDSDDSINEAPPQKRLRLSDNQIDPKPSTPRATDYIVDRVMETKEGVIQDSVASDDNVEEEIPRHSGDLAWNSVTGLNLKNLLFTELNPGVNTELQEYYMKSPLEFYELFLDEEILSMMVTETNRYAAQCRAKQQKQEVTTGRIQRLSK